MGIKLTFFILSLEESGPDSTSNFPGKDGSWSDSESGFLHPPIKSKLKGLLGTWGRNRRQLRNQNGHRTLVPSISDPVPILQPATATVSEYARKIEILASDLANGSAMTTPETNAGQQNLRLFSI